MSPSAIAMSRDILPYNDTLPGTYPLADMYVTRAPLQHHIKDSIMRAND